MNIRSNNYHGYRGVRRGGKAFEVIVVEFINDVSTYEADNVRTQFFTRIFYTITNITDTKRVLLLLLLILYYIALIGRERA